MRKTELDQLLERTVAEALGLTVPVLANSHGRHPGKPRPAYAPKFIKPAMHMRPAARVTAHA